MWKLSKTKIDDADFETKMKELMARFIKLTQRITQAQK